MNWIVISGAVQLGLLMGLLALAVFLSFRVLNFPDMTVEGSFPLGACVSAALIAAQVNPIVATFAGVIAAALAGAMTAWLNVRLGILHLLAGILVSVGLYSVNLRIMDAPNIALIGSRTVFTLAAQAGAGDTWSYPAVFIVALVFCSLALCWFLGTETGLAMRATGENPRMSRANGANTRRLVILGVALSNAMAGLCGSLFAQSQGSADVSMGIGMIVIGLASVIIGETLLPSRRIAVAVVGAIVGSILYRIVVAVALDSDVLGIKAQDMNLVTAVLVGGAMVLPRLRGHYKAMAARGQK
jgi:putative ABC transport system permease protein